MSEARELKFGQKSIEYELFYKPRKTMGIQVYPDCSVKVSAPENTSIQRIEQKLKKKAPWIIKQQNEFLSYHPLTPERKFVNGETHLYLGRQYRLRIEEADKNEVKLYRGRLNIFTHPQSSPEKVLNNWYRERAELHFNKILSEKLNLFKRYGVEAAALQLRYMKRRWGSCTAHGKVILNPELIKAPKGSIEYVVIHELCHLVHRNHNKEFYTLQEKFMPDWKEWRERLEHKLA